MVKDPPPAKERAYDHGGGGAREPEPQPRGAGSTTDAFWGDQYESLNYTFQSNFNSTLLNIRCIFKVDVEKMFKLFLCC